MMITAMRRHEGKQQEDEMTPVQLGRAVQQCVEARVA